jgi:hypothetical protein
MKDIKITFRTVTCLLLTVRICGSQRMRRLTWLAILSHSSSRSPRSSLTMMTATASPAAPITTCNTSQIMSITRPLPFHSAVSSLKALIATQLARLFPVSKEPVGLWYYCSHRYPPFYCLQIGCWRGSCGGEQVALSILLPFQCNISFRLSCTTQTLAFSH